MRLLPFGDRAVLAEVGTLAEVLTLHARLAATRPDGVIDLVPAARTVLVCVDPTVLGLPAARQWIAAAGTTEQGDAGAPGALVEVPIAYDGPDLAHAASLLGISVDELIARHRGADWTVAFTGFAPGFGYLVSQEWRVDVPRRASPRTRVPAGAVGLAGEFSGAYPRATPGGWQLIGTTSAPLFSPDAASPVLLPPGTRVRFVPERAEAVAAAAAPAAPVEPPAPAAPVEPPARIAPPAPAAPRAPRDGATPQGRRQKSTAPSSGSGAVGSGAEASETRPAAPALEILEPGLLSTIQDLGRPGRLADGIAMSGAADRGALRTANRLVGNREDAAGIEVTMGGLRAVARRDLWFAVAGAWGPIRLEGQEVDPYAAHVWPAGAQLQLDWFGHGVRGYLAIRGGIDAPLAVGSRSTDTLAGLGPPPLRAGDAFGTAGTTAGPVPPEDLHPWSPEQPAILELDVAPGPRADWFAETAALFDAVWKVTNQADRVGIRLDGPELPRVANGEAPSELPSEGMVAGALQVPPSGRPVILGPDGPVTGGYPVIAVVVDAGRDALAQARPGTLVRFRHARPV